jgi:hypothetical protein
VTLDSRTYTFSSIARHAYVSLQPNAIGTPSALTHVHTSERIRSEHVGSNPSMHMATRMQLQQLAPKLKVNILAIGPDVTRTPSKSFALVNVDRSCLPRECQVQAHPFVYAPRRDH